MKNWLSFKFNLQFLIFLFFFIGSITLKLIEMPGARSPPIIIPFLFSIINILVFLLKGIKKSKWEAKYLLISFLYFTISLKLFYIYYNIFIPIILVAISVYVLMNQEFSSERIKSRLHLLTIIVTLLIFIPDISIFKFYQPTDRKIWGDDIEWEDFEGPKPSDINNRLSRVSFTISYEYNRAYNYPNLISVTTMVKSLSWIKPGYDNNDLLEHERLHVDICEVIRNQFEDSVKSIENKDSTKIYETYKSYLVKNKKMQVEYDSITNHGLDSIEQAKWNKKIKILLK